MGTVVRVRFWPGLLAARAARAEAVNPTTPVPRLQSLLRNHPQQVLRNPALPLVLVESPTFWAELPEETQQVLVALRPCPPAFAQWVAAQTAWRPSRFVAEFLGNATVAAAQRRAYFLGSHLMPEPAEPRAYAYDLTAFLPADERALFEKGLKGLAAGAAPVLTEDELDRLAALGRTGHHLAVSQLGLSLDRLRQLSNGDDCSLTALLRHPDFPADESERLACSPHERSRQIAASRAALSAERFEALSVDPSAKVISNLAGNPKLPAAVAAKLVGSKDMWVRVNLAMNPATPEAQQLTLTDDPEFIVRDFLARRKDLTPALIEKLSADRESMVRSNLASNDALLEFGLKRFLKSDDEALRAGLAGSIHLPRWAQRALAWDRSRSVLWALWKRKDRDWPLSWRVRLATIRNRLRGATR